MFRGVEGAVHGEFSKLALSPEGDAGNGKDCCIEGIREAQPTKERLQMGKGGWFPFLGWRMRLGMCWRNLVGLVAGELHQTMEHG